MSESTDLRVVGAMIDIIELLVPDTHNDVRDVNDVINRLSTILVEGTSIRIDKRREIVGWVKERYWQEKAEQESTDDS